MFWEREGDETLEVKRVPLTTLQDSWWTALTTHEALCFVAPPCLHPIIDRRGTTSPLRLLMEFPVGGRSPQELLV